MNQQNLNREENKAPVASVPADPNSAGNMKDPVAGKANACASTAPVRSLSSGDRVGQAPVSSVPEYPNPAGNAEASAPDPCEYAGTRPPLVPLPFDAPSRRPRAGELPALFKYAGPDEESGLDYDIIEEAIAASPETYTLSYLHGFYDKLLQLNRDGSDFYFFRTKKQYKAIRNTILSYSKAAGYYDEMREYIAGKEGRVLDAFEKGVGLKGFRCRCAADFSPETASFLWRPYVPMGEYTVLMAPGGTGKTYFCCALAAAVTRGYIPMSGINDLKPQDAMFITAEERGGELSSRLAACGADLSRVHIADCEMTAGLSLSTGINRFFKLIRSCGAKLVVIDPWQAFLGKDVDVNRINQLRPVLQSVSLLAKKADCAIILISHVGKRVAAENLNNAAIGSTDLVNAARSAIYLTNYDNGNRRIAIHSKSNYAKTGDSLLFSIDGREGVKWLGFSPLDRQTTERALRSGQTIADFVERDKEERERLRDLADALRALAEPGKTVTLTYDELREDYGEEIFCGMSPKTAVEKALELIPTSGVRVARWKNISDINPTNNKRTTRRGFDLYQAVPNN